MDPVTSATLYYDTNTFLFCSWVYSFFQVALEETRVFDCSSPKNPVSSSQRESHGQCVTAQVHLRDEGNEMTLTVADGTYYDVYYNTRLQNGRDYYIISQAVSQWGRGKTDYYALEINYRWSLFIRKE